MILNNAHWTMKYYKQRMTIREWKQVLLDGDDALIFGGDVVRLKAKYLGAGVYEVYKDIAENR